ncbi:MAG TPA: hypothetical protein VF299_03625 [Mycobacterium sp.]
MSRLRVVRPSLRRVFWSIVAVAVVCCVLAGLLLYGYDIVTHDDPEPTPKGDYVNLFVVELTIWGPIAVLTIWYITVPVIVALGVLAASIRRATPSGGGNEQTSSGR